MFPNENVVLFLRRERRKSPGRGGGTKIGLATKTQILEVEVSLRDIYMNERKEN